jgi:uncharacterized coiled-coil protein SlyX
MNQQKIEELEGELTFQRLLIKELIETLQCDPKFSTQDLVKKLQSLEEKHHPNDQSSQTHSSEKLTALKLRMFWQELLK